MVLPGSGKNKKKISKRPRQRLTQNNPSSPEVFSYRSKRAPVENKSGGPKVNILAVFKHIPILLASAAIVICLVYVLILNANVNVISLNAKNNPLPRDKAVYQTAASKLLAGSLTAKTKLTINTDSFERALSRQFPELTHVSVTLPLVGHRPLVEVSSDGPALLLNDQNNNQFVIDEEGRAIMPANDLAQAVRSSLPVVKDQTTTAVTLGQNVLTAGDTGFIREVVTQLQAKQLKVEFITLPAIANEAHVKLKDQPYIIKFNTATNARQAAGTFLAVKQKLDNEHIVPREYVDVRIEEKSFYK